MHRMAGPGARAHRRDMDEPTDPTDRPFPPTAGRSEGRRPPHRSGPTVGRTPVGGWSPPPPAPPTSMLPPPPGTPPPPPPPSWARFVGGEQPEDRLDDESDAERRSRSASAAAAWVGLIGAGLLLLGAAVVLTQSWPDQGEAIRAGGLIAGCALAVWLGERLRRALPVNATIDAHIGAYLVAPAGIATASFFGRTWPLCIAVGGLLATAATEIQSRRWPPRWFLAGQVVAICLVATGVGASTEVTPAVVAVLVAAAFEAAGKHRRAVALASIAVLSPCLWVAAQLRMGPGTLERAGLVGDRLDWSRVVVGLIAGAVFAAVAHRTSTRDLYLAAIAAPIVSGADRIVWSIEKVGSWLTRYGVTTGDRWWATIALALLAGGFVARRFRQPTSWEAYGAGLIVLWCWLVGTVAVRDTAWALPTALVVGIVAAGLGAWFRLGAPLVAGTALVAGALLAGSWDAIVGAPTWIWLTTGGATLLAVAVAVERSGTRTTPDVHALLDRWG